MTHPILDGRTEQPQRPHVQDQMEPPAMQKHHGEEGQDIRGVLVGFPRCKGLGITRGNQRELAQEQLKLIGAQAVLEQERQAIDSD